MFSLTPDPVSVDPAAQPEERPFWEGLAEGVLRIPWCDRCDMWVWRPRSHCTTCYQPVARWIELSGRGHIYSYSIVHRGEGAFSSDGPYVLAWIQLDGGPVILGNIVSAADAVVVGQSVKLVPGGAPDRDVRAAFEVFR